MNINATFKIVIGWVLVVVGLAVIGQTINYSYQYFTAKIEFPPVFKTAVVGAPQTTAGQNTVTGQVDAQAQIQQALSQATGQALSNMLPADSIMKLLNLISWSIFATLLVFAGGKICSIGIQLLSVKNNTTAI